MKSQYRDINGKKII